MSGTGRLSNTKTSSGAPPRRISFFFPVYNDAETVEPLTLALREVLAAHSEEYEIIIVVDASPDDSGEVADEMAARFPEVRVIHHPENRGYGPAILSGVEAARYEWVAFTDGDMQFDVKELPALVEAARSYDIVAGYRVKRADPWYRVFFAWGYNLCLRIFINIPLRDMDCAFKLMRKEIFQDITFSMEYREAFVLVEVFYKALNRGFLITQVPVSHYKREHGSSQSFSFGNLLRFTRYLLWGIYNARIARRW